MIIQKKIEDKLRNARTETADMIKTISINLQEKTKRKLVNLDKDLDNFVSSIPNLIDEDVPEGKDEEDNLELRTSGNPRNFNFTPF